MPCPSIELGVVCQGSASGSGSGSCRSPAKCTPEEPQKEPEPFFYCANGATKTSFPGLLLRQGAKGRGGPPLVRASVTARPASFGAHAVPAMRVVKKEEELLAIGEKIGFLM